MKRLALMLLSLTSLMAAQVNASTPSSVRLIFRSVRMRASTGNAVTDIATPMNSAKLVKGTPTGAKGAYNTRATTAPSQSKTPMAPAGQVGDGRRGDADRQFGYPRIGVRVRRGKPGVEDQNQIAAAAALELAHDRPAELGRRPPMHPP